MTEPERITHTILYSPVTNGQAEASIANGAKLIEAYANSFKPVWQTASKPPEHGFFVRVKISGRINIHPHYYSKANWYYPGSRKPLDRNVITHWAEFESDEDNADDLWADDDVVFLDNEL